MFYNCISWSVCSVYIYSRRVPSSSQHSQVVHVDLICIISYLFGSIVVNLSCKNSHYYRVQEEQSFILFASQRLRMVILTLKVQNFHSLTLRQCKNGNYYVVRAYKNGNYYTLRALKNGNSYTCWIHSYMLLILIFSIQINIDINLIIFYRQHAQGTLTFFFYFNTCKLTFFN